ncbi:MAG: hypothetical protein DHS20C18_56140 [Saprospiraceae bacterium]|nr:MAG: hypothetical protein DHS20C18_56140 [Saprospiraceae bacterium]
MKWIYNILRISGLKNQELLEEYFDHYTSEYEYLLEQGDSEELAHSKVVDAISKLDVKTINFEYFKLKHKNKLIMSSTFTFLFAAVIFVFGNFDEPPSIAPVEMSGHSITSGYGERMHPTEKVKKLHRGIDIRGKLGTTVMATSSGIVKDAGYDKLNGYFVEIQHDAIYTTRYHHLSKIDVQKDDQVKKGEKIGEIGSSGLSTAPHLHYEVLEKGKNVDPALFLKV